MVPDWQAIATIVAALVPSLTILFAWLEVRGKLSLTSAQTAGVQIAANLDDVKTMEIVNRTLEAQMATKDVAIAKLEAAQARTERQMHEDALKSSKELIEIRQEHEQQMESRNRERDELTARVDRMGRELSEEKKAREQLQRELEAEKKAREALEKRLQEAEAENAKLRKLLEDKDVLISDLRGEVNALKEAQSGEKAA